MSGPRRGGGRPGGRTGRRKGRAGRHGPPGGAGEVAGTGRPGPRGRRPVRCHAHRDHEDPEARSGMERLAISCPETVRQFGLEEQLEQAGRPPRGSGSWPSAFRLPPGRAAWRPRPGRRHDRDRRADRGPGDPAAIAGAAASRCATRRRLPSVRSGLRHDTYNPLRRRSGRSGCGPCHQGAISPAASSRQWQSAST